MRHAEIIEGVGHSKAELQRTNLLLQQQQQASNGHSCANSPRAWWVWFRWRRAWLVAHTDVRMFEQVPTYAQAYNQPYLPVMARFLVCQGCCCLEVLENLFS